MITVGGQLNLTNVKITTTTILMDKDNLGGLRSANWQVLTITGNKRWLAKDKQTDRRYINYAIPN